MKALVVTIVSLLYLGATARKTFHLPASKKAAHPLVKAYDDTLCIFKDDAAENWWCFDHATDVQIGWQWIQAYTSLNSVFYWQLQFNVYSKQEITIHPELNLKDAYYGQMTFSFSQFEI